MIALAIILPACGAPVATPGYQGAAAGQPQSSGAGTNAPAAAAAGTAAFTPPATSYAGAGAAGSASTQEPDGTPVATASDTHLPCDVQTVLVAKCQNCHGTELIGGAPMSLVKQSDFMGTMMSRTTMPGQVMPVAQLVKMRINDAAKPMPQGGLLPMPELTTMNTWLDSGTPQGTAADATACAGVGVPTTKPPVDLPKTDPGVLNADGTRCYTFTNHGKSEPGDTSKYPVPTGEHYVEFFYTAPWTEPSELVRFRTIYDNRKVLHHWLFYSTLGNGMNGAIAPSIGTHIGDSAQLIAGWAVGGDDVAMPEGVGLRMPAPGAGLMVEYHMYNTGTAVEEDATGIEFCVVPAGSTKHTAGMTWLGTENFNGIYGMPPKVMSSYSGTCLPSRKGAAADEPITIFRFWPHMHNYGRNMKSVVTRVGGLQEEVFNKPFDFNYQVSYEANLVLAPGDTITSTCDFLNTSNAPVAFGPSTSQEMCFQFAYSYPAGALDNGVASLVGATNTCW